MELLFNYIFAIMQPFSKDGWQVVSIVALFFLFKNWKYWKKDKLILSLFAFIIYGTILSFFSTHQIEAFKEMKDYAVGWLLSFMMGYSIINIKDKINLMKTYITVFMLIIFAGFLAYFGIIPQTIGVFKLSEVNRLCVFNSPTLLADRCNFIIIPLIILFINYRNNIKSYWLLAIAVYFTYALLLTGTRNCYISLFITSILIICFYIYKYKNILKSFIVLIIFPLLFFIIYLTNPAIHNRINNTDINKEASLADRITMYKYGLQLIKEKPIFGYTPKTAIYDQKNINNLPHFHNIYIEIFATFGIIGFILFIFIIYNIFKRLIILYKQTNSTFALMLIFAWIAILMSECFDASLKYTQNSGLYFWATGLILDNNNLKETKTY